MKTRDIGHTNHPCLFLTINNNNNTNNKITTLSSRSSSTSNHHHHDVVNNHHQHLGLWNRLTNNKPSKSNYLGNIERTTLIYSLLLITIFFFMIHHASCQFYDPPTNLQYFRSSSNRRRWIITGNFTTITVNNKTETYTGLNNIAVWNGNTWKGLGNGTNGLVRSQFIDTCYNMYVGGDFSRAGNLSTGPIARWSISKQRWESITDNVVWSTNSKIYSISVDCYNTPSEASRCNCNVWVAGQFELTITNSTLNATNIAVYHVLSNTWNSLKDTNGHNLTLSNTVRTVFKRDFGQTFNSRKTFIGGNFPYLLTWDPYYKIWEKIEMGNSSQQATVVNQIHFHKGILTIDLFDYWNYVVVGDFEFTANYTDTNSTTTCKNLCFLDFRHGTWTQPPLVELGQTLQGSVEHVSMSDGNLCAVGNFTSGDDSIKGLVSVTVGGIDYERFNSTLIYRPFSSIYVCKETDLECAPKSAGLADDQGVVLFYDSETKSFIEFGRVNEGGVVELINSIYLYGGIESKL